MMTIPTPAASSAGSPARPPPPKAAKHGRRQPLQPSRLRQPTAAEAAAAAGRCEESSIADRIAAAHQQHAERRQPRLGLAPPAAAAPSPIRAPAFTVGAAATAGQLPLGRHAPPPPLLPAAAAHHPPRAEPAPSEAAPSAYAPSELFEHLADAVDGGVERHRLWRPQAPSVAAETRAARLRDRAVLAVENVIIRTDTAAHATRHLTRHMGLATGSAAVSSPAR